MKKGKELSRMEISGHAFFTEFLIVLVIATLIALFFERFHLPPILGFLIAGILIGPHGFALISDSGGIEGLAELGIIFLMLTIGIEFSFDRLRGLWKFALLGGGAQLLISLGIGMLAANFLQWTYYWGFVLGAVIALSSTAIVLKQLIDNGEIDTSHGRLAVAILIFQDIAVVPLMILIDTFGDTSAGLAQSLLSAGLKTALFIGTVTLLWKFVLTRFLHWVATTRNREIFLLATISICFGGAWLSGAFGFSMAIGAFFVGLMLANTPYGNQITGEIIPFRHIFVSIFFVSIGMLFDPQFTVTHLGMVSLLVGLVLVVNFIVTTLIIIALGHPPRIALLTGLILSQIGEFSFLLLQTGLKSGSIDAYFYQILLSVAFLTILLTPFLFKAIPFILRACEKIPYFGLPPQEILTLQQEKEMPGENHVIVCGFGRVGRDLVTALQQESIPLVVLDMNPRNVKEARAIGAKVIYGDATNEVVLRKAGVKKAKAVVVSIGDPIGMVHIVRVVERLNPDTLLVVRTRFEKDVPKLYDLGVDMVVMEELETSLELNRAVLENFNVPPERIKAHIAKIRARKELAIEKAIFKQFSE